MSTTVAAPAAASRRRNQRALAGAAIGLAIGMACTAALRWSESSLSRPLERAELATVDLRFLADPQTAGLSPDLVVLKIDDDARNVIGQWPMPRSAWTQFLQVLAQFHVKAVVIDYAFQDRSSDSTTRLQGDMPWPTDAGEDDHVFSLVLRQMGNVAFGVFAQDVDPLAGDALDDRRFRRATGQHPLLIPFLRRRFVPLTGPATQIRPYTSGMQPRLVVPQADVLVGARALGEVNVQPAEDSGGTVRRFYPFLGVERAWPAVPSLPIAGYALTIASSGTNGYWNVGSVAPPDDTWPPLPGATSDGSTLRIGDRSIPLLLDGSAWIHWRGNWDQNRRLKKRVLAAGPLLAQNVLDALYVHGPTLDADAPELEAEGVLPKGYLDALRNKVVVVGFTAQGEMQDYVSTPFGNQPGVYMQASALDTLLTGDFLRSVPTGLNWLLILLAPTAIGFLVLAMPESRSGYAVFTLAVLLAPGLLFIPLYAAFGFALFHFGWIVNLFHVELGTLLTTLFSAGLAWVFMQRDHEVEQARRQKLDALFTRVVSPDVARQLLTKDPSHLLGGERTELTVYFSDIEGFTTISERLAPERLLEVLNEYLTRVTELLQDRSHATVDKYIGDAVMAFWGAPTPAPDAATRACLAAIEAKAIMDEFSVELVRRGLPPLRTRIGINTGPAIVGGVGHPRRVSYTALGDTVNLASRLEGANKAYGTTCMLGPDTYAQARDSIVARELDLVKVKGKHIPVHVYELMGRADQPLEREREIKHRYEAALARFRARDFAGAREEFAALAAQTGDPPSSVFVERCVERLASPPPSDWDGSNELHEK